MTTIQNVIAVFLSINVGIDWKRYFKTWGEALRHSSSEELDWEVISHLDEAHHYVLHCASQAQLEHMKCLIEELGIHAFSLSGKIPKKYRERNFSRWKDASGGVLLTIDNLKSVDVGVSHTALVCRAFSVPSRLREVCLQADKVVDFGGNLPYIRNMDPDSCGSEGRKLSSSRGFGVKQFKVDGHASWYTIDEHFYAHPIPWEQLDWRRTLEVAYRLDISFV